MIKNSENRVSSNNFNGKSIRSLTSAINGIDRATSSSLERYQMLNRKSPIRKKTSKESSFFKKNSQNNNDYVGISNINTKNKGDWSARVETNPT